MRGNELAIYVGVFGSTLAIEFQSSYSQLIKMIFFIAFEFNLDDNACLAK